MVAEPSESKVQAVIRPLQRFHCERAVRGKRVSVAAAVKIVLVISKPQIHSQSIVPEWLVRSERQADAFGISGLKSRCYIG